MADVKKVKVGVTEDTCNLNVKELVMNDKPIPTPNDHSPPASASGAATSQAGWEWHIESLAKVAGVESIDDLTKTYAWFNFKTGEITGGGPLFGGSDPGGRCYAARMIAKSFQW